MSTRSVIFWFICSISLNALGNSFMIAANLGSAPWTSAGQNLVSLLPMSIGVWIILLNIVAFFISYFMKVTFTLATVVKSIALASVFGLFIDLFVYAHQLVLIPDNLFVRCLYLFIGINFIAIAVCIYFQCNSVYLPFDYLLQAFAKLKNNYTIGSMMCLSIPLSISILICLFQQHIKGLGIGTIFFVIGLGFLIDRYNKYILINRVPHSKSHSI